MSQRSPIGPFLMAFALAGVSALGAQGSGSIHGTVTGSVSKAPVSGACIALDQATCSAITDRHGSYTVRGVSPGSHALTVTAIGSKPSRQTVQVSAGQAATVDVSLEAGPLLLSSIISSATRLPTEGNKVASTVNLLTPEQIATSPARETQDMLREIPGVELPRTSSNVGGTAQIVSIRGVDEGRTVVNFDGIPVGDAWGEWIDWGRVPKGMVDHVEVVEGGTSNLYGNGAIGGVISFYSRPMAPGSTLLTLDGGSRDARHAYLAAGIPIARGLTANVSGDYLKGGGYIMLDPLKRGTVDVPSEITSKNAYVRLNYAPSGNWSAFLTGHGFGDERHTGTPAGLQTRDQQSGDFGLNHGTSATGLLMVRSWYGHQNEFQRATSVRSNSSSCSTPSTAARQCEDSSAIVHIPSTDWGLNALWSRDGLFGFQSLTVGADYRHMGGTYNEDDYSTSCPGAACGTFLRSISSGGDQNLSGAFVQGILAPAAPVRVELGARFDRWENNNGKSVDPAAGTVRYDNRSKNAFSPRVGVRVEATSRLSLHGAFYQAFRAPNLAELYRKQINAGATQITLPNPDLKPEWGRGWEGGLDWQPVNWLELKGTAYVADYHDFNVPTTISAAGVTPVIRQRLNVSRSRSKGGGAYLVLRPVQSFTLAGSANWDNARVVSNDATNGTRINRVPSPKYTVRGSWKSEMLGTFTAIYRYEGHTTTLQGVDLAPFSVVDANVQREIAGGITGFVSLENIGDAKYQVNISGTGNSALISYGLPRTLRAGLTWSR
jgi:outer membrane receptor protein involved in Fe transport